MTKSEFSDNSGDYGEDNFLSEYERIKKEYKNGNV
jgi:hypothetical protein